jgi:hypothetical protein
MSSSNKVCELVSFLNQSPTIVNLSKEQWKELNSNCSKWLNKVTTFSGEDAGSIVKRLGLILYRICMIFTALRKFEDGNISSEQTCTDIDFNTASKLFELYLQHSLFMYNNLPKQNGNTVFRSGNNKQNFFDALPSDFKRAEAVELGKSFYLSTRSVDNLLKELIGEYLTQNKFGNYLKI